MIMSANTVTTSTSTSSLEIFLRKIRCTKTELQLTDLVRKLNEYGIQTLPDLNNLSDTDWVTYGISHIRDRVQMGFQKIKNAKTGSDSSSKTGSSSKSTSNSNLGIARSNANRDNNVNSSDSKHSDELQKVNSRSNSQEFLPNNERSPEQKVIAVEKKMSKKKKSNGESDVNNTTKSKMRRNSKSQKSIEMTQDNYIGVGESYLKQARRINSEPVIVSKNSTNSKHVNYHSEGHINPELIDSNEEENKMSKKDVRNILSHPDAQQKFIKFIRTNFNIANRNNTDNNLENEADINICRIRLWNECQKYKETPSLYLTKAHVIWQRYLDDNPYEETKIDKQLIEYIRHVIWRDEDGTDNQGLLEADTFQPLCTWVEESLRGIATEFQEKIKFIQIVNSSPVNKRKFTLQRVNTKTSLGKLEDLLRSIPDEDE